MASWEVTGRIVNIRFLPESVLVCLEENKLGYKKKDGTRVDETCYLWNVIFPLYFKKYISGHFSSGFYVKVKGEIAPFLLRDGQSVDGYSIKGETMNMAAFPKNISKERRMVKESQNASTGTPDLNGYMQDDF